jgi:hypothetical protein
MQPIAFTDEMMERLTTAAALLPANSRDGFTRTVINRISDLGYRPGLAELEVAIQFVLNARGVAGSRGAFTTKTKGAKSASLVRTRADRHFRQGASDDQIRR